MSAAEDVIAAHGVVHLNVHDVARRAGVAVGTIYHRFGDRTTFLRAYYDRFFARADGAFDPDRWQQLSLAELIEAYARLLVRTYHARRKLLRELFLYVRTYRDPDFQARAERFNARFLRQLSALMLTRRAEIEHPDPERAVTFSLALVDAVAKERILFSRGERSLPADQVSALIRELTRAVRAYLGVGEVGR
jgi:AcrR family transcriptional regulator